MQRLLALPYSLAWLLGATIRLCLWWVAAFIAGFKAGRGVQEDIGGA